MDILDKKNQLHATPVASVIARLAKSKPKLTVVGEEVTIAETLTLMNSSKVTSIPVHKTGDSAKYIGLLSLFDIVSYLVLSATTGTDAATIEEHGKKKLADPIGSVLGTSDSTRESFKLWTFNESDKLEKVLDVLSKGVHRALVLPSSEGNSPILISQTDVLNYIAYYSAYFNTTMVEQTLETLHLYPSKPYGVSLKNGVVSANQKDITVMALRKMVLEEVTCVPVLDDAGDIVASFSVSDMRGFVETHFSDLALPVSEFLKKKADTGAKKHHTQLLAHPDHNLQHVVVTMLDAKVHRLWIVDPHKKKEMGVVSMTDIMSKFSKYDYHKS